jgi:hypothetical protein
MVNLGLGWRTEYTIDLEHTIDENNPGTEHIIQI